MPEAHAWDERLDLGDEAVDPDHHLQIALVSALADALEQRRPSMARRFADQLAGYSAFHFSGEELLMDDSAYPRAEAHGREHKALLAQIDEIRAAMQGEDHDLALSLTLDFRTALGAHVTSSDRLVVEGRRAARRAE
jgi:hemerythrin